MRVVAFDLETTGLDKENDRIVEFCFLTLDADLRQTGRWTQRVDPGVPIPQEAVDVHGITDADVDGLPGFDHFAPRVQSLLKESVLVVYNHQFDVPFLHHELLRAGQPGVRPDHPVVDPYLLFKQYAPHNLGHAVRDYLAREHDDAHGAESDATATVEVLRAQIERHHLPRDVRQVVVSPGKKWLDFSRKVYRDSDGVARFGFGKHADEPVLDHPGYVEWVQSRDFPDDTKRVLARLVSQETPRVQTRAAGTDPEA